jgi:hypothetical protein
MVGTALGTIDGIRLAILEGANVIGAILVVGSIVGRREVGAALGLTLGDALGDTLGTREGSTVGLSVDSNV